MTACDGGSLDHKDVIALSEQLAGLGIPPSELSLDIILSGPGGNPHAAYKLGKILRARSHEVRFFIPGWAKSAATLLALSGDTIHMGLEAELGPIDIQMEHSNLEGRGLFSAIEAVHPINYFRQLSENIANSTARVLRETYSLSRRESAELALRHAADLIAPILNQMEPAAVSQAARQVDVTWAYATDFLDRYHLDEANDDNRRELAQSIAKNLVWLFPDHAYVIWRDKARELGLRVEDGENDPAWPAVVRAYNHHGGMTGSAMLVALEEKFMEKYKEGA